MEVPVVIKQVWDQLIAMVQSVSIAAREAIGLVNVTSHTKRKVDLVVQAEVAEEVAIKMVDFESL